MPTYEYRCTKPNCAKDFEVSASMNDPAPTQGPGCSSQNCSIEKKLSRVSAWVKGGSIAKESAKASVRDQQIIRAGGGREPPKAETPALEDPVHICSKYCGHHKSAQ